MAEHTANAKPIRIYGDPVLRKKADPVTAIDDGLLRTAAQMVATLEQARGLGLAAPQIGCSRQLCVINLPALDEKQTKPLALLNPVVTARQGRVTLEEGCLSFPQLYAEVARPRSITVTGVGLDGNELEIEASELLARVLSHEIDHLNGVLFIDHLSVLKRQLLRKELKELTAKARTPAQG
ncbi:MAG TPA: peptide deformylase [Candidatus Edwardsbacteria bacterium]|nr:peptide deformylase [Candidatus Edwardsbacteria bacterium]